MNASILNTIGNTPLVEIKRLNPNPKVRLLAKLECLNPGGSIKDRAAMAMIEAGEKSGELTPDKTVIEATSGNTGIGLAFVCAVKGYKLLLTMSEAVSMERRRILSARGAEIQLTPGHLGTDGAIEAVYRLARENPEAYFVTDQFNNPANWQAHYNGTAMEIWDQTGGQITTFVATMGTTGTLMGASRRLKELNPDIEIIGVEPYLGHKIQGLKNLKESYCPEIFDKHCLDRKINVDDEEAFEMTRRLAREEGIFAGMSSGAAMAMAAKVASQMESGTLVTIFPDSGERYLSTPLFTIKAPANLKLFNTLTRRKEVFEPLSPGKVSVYSCGPTVHARANIGLCRRYIFSDLLCRYLEYRGFNVKHIMNITDLDDKTIAGSNEAGQSLQEFTDHFAKLFRQDLTTLGIKPAAAFPRASENVQEMVALTEKLVEKGFAYEKLHSLYFNISRFQKYGQLSNIDLDKIKLGHTVDLDEYEKENPRDFTLLRRIRLPELRRGIFTSSPWGNVRPSWHIQCAAMSMKYLGETFDIHTSGRELAFPHHENEIAIAGALTGKPLAKFWIHSDRVLMDGKKIADAATSLTIEDLISQGYSGQELRYWFLATHYRKPLHFSAERLNEARQSLNRLNRCISALQAVHNGTANPDTDQIAYNLKHDFIRAMDDDLNVSVAMAAVFRNIKAINQLLLSHNIDAGGAAVILNVFQSLNGVLNVMNFAPPKRDSHIEQLINERQQARVDQDWERADRLRDQLRDLAVTVCDKPVQRN